MAGDHWKPVQEAFRLTPRWPTLLIFVLLLAQAVGLRGVQAEMLSSEDAGSEMSNYYLLLLGTFLISAFLLLFVARIFIAPQLGRRPPDYLRWIGFYMMAGIAGQVFQGVLTVVLFSVSSSEHVYTFGNIVVGSLSQIAVFPITIAALLGAAGENRIGLGTILARCLEIGRWAYLWFALVTLAFPVSMVLVFVAISDMGSVANEGIGNVLQSILTTIGYVFGLLLTVVTAHIVARPPGGNAKVFA